jgi:hypothetical protein
VTILDAGLRRHDPQVANDFAGVLWCTYGPQLANGFAGFLWLMNGLQISSGFCEPVMPQAWPANAVGS